MKKEESDEELLREFEWAKEHAADDDVPQPCSNELKRILKKVEAERKERYN